MGAQKATLGGPKHCRGTLLHHSCMKQCWDSHAWDTAKTLTKSKEVAHGIKKTPTNKSTQIFKYYHTCSRSWFTLFLSCPELVNPPTPPPAALTAKSNCQVKHQLVSQVELLLHSLLHATCCKRPALLAGQCHKCCSTAEGAQCPAGHPPSRGEPPDKSSCPQLLSFERG